MSRSLKPFGIELAIRSLEKRKIIEINKNNTPYSNKNGKQKEAQEMNGDVSKVLEICDKRLRYSLAAEPKLVRWTRSARPQRRISRIVHMYMYISCRKNGYLLFSVDHVSYLIYTVTYI